MKHPWYNQQLKHLQNVIEETSNKTPTRMLFQGLAELLRLEIRLSGTFKDVPYDKLKNALTSTWLTDYS